MKEMHVHCRTADKDTEKNYFDQGHPRSLLVFILLSALSAVAQSHGCGGQRGQWKVRDTLALDSLGSQSCTDA